MQDLVLQEWTTIRCAASVGGGVTSLTQDEGYHLDTRGFSDVGFLIDVTDLTLPGSGATISLSVESAPTADDALFQAIAPPLVFDGVDVTASPFPIQLKSVRTPSTASLAALLRWRLNVSAGASGTWGMTFRIRAIPGRSRFFVPTDIAGNVGWFRSDIGIGKDASTNKVNTWADQSGLGHDLTSAGGNRPTWLASSINGRPSVYFDPTAGAQVMATSTFSMGPWTVLMVTTGQDATDGWFWTRSTGATPRDTFYGSVNQTMYTERGGTVSAWDNSAGVGWGRWGTQAKLLTTRFDGTHAGHTLRINGADPGLVNNFAGDPGTSTTSDKFTIGAGDGGGAPSRIKVAEVVVYDRALSIDELVIVEEYLRRRYGLY